MRTRTFRATALSVLAAFSLVAAACGDDDDDDAGDAPATAGERTTAATTADRRPPPSGTTGGSGGAPRPRPAAARRRARRPPPTAPPRGDADLVIWADDTRQAVVQEIADVFGEENGITVAVQQLAVRSDPRAAQPRRAGRRGPRHRRSAPTTGSASSSPTACSSRSTSAASPTEFQEVAIEAFTYDGKLYGVPYASRTSPSSATPTSCPRRRRRGRRWSRSPPTTRPSTPTTRRYLGLALQVGAGGRPLPLPADPDRVRRLHVRPERGRHVQPRRLGLDSPGGLDAASSSPRRPRPASSAPTSLRRDDPELRRGQGAVRHHRAVGDLPRRTPASPPPACRTR